MTSRRFLIFITVTVILMISGCWVWAQPLPGARLIAGSDIVTNHTTDIETKEKTMKFPIATGSNLLRQKLNLPADFEGELNIILIAFEQWQQNTINTWLPFVEQLEQRYDGLRYYELPVIKRMNFIVRTFINEGMRAGIPNKKARERTITLYLDKPAFRQALDLAHERDIYILIVDRDSNVVWRAEGAFTPEKGEALSKAIGQIQGQNSPIHHLNFDDYRWQNRLLLVFAPNATTDSYTEQMRLLAERPGEIAERDLLIFSLFEEETSYLKDPLISVAAARDARARFDVASDSFAVLLIGKDGGIKLQSGQPVSPTDIFGLIDTMPMRQREMQEQSRVNP